MDLLFQCLGNEATRPLASEVFAGDNCPFSMLVARGRVVTLSWFLSPPHESFLCPAEHHGEQQCLQGAQQLTSLAGRGGLGETCCFKGIFVQSNCSLVSGEASRRTLYCLH